MFQFTVALHIILCILLVLIILLQPGKGGDVGAAFGGGSGGGMFGPRGPATLLSRATTGVAVMFMVTSIALALFSNDSVMNNSNLDDLLGTEEGVEGALELNPKDEDAGTAADGIKAAPGPDEAPGAGEAPGTDSGAGE